MWYSLIPRYCTRAFAISPQILRELCRNVLLSIRGRRECRALDAPQPRVQSKKAHEIVTTVTPDTPGIPYAMVLTVSFVLSRVIGFVVTLIGGITSADLTPASRRQDHTTSSSANVPFVGSTFSVHRIPSRVRDDREPPLVGTRWQRL
jgi:hypothetical protein